ncbi:Uncharacterized SAM-binding protein YcdF, DUF218 family [Ferrimonas sediminum]|uniref:Uncharacterized SAM-binding protein YcdF, DUF218 family n=1 Tax=Ferrimonas sediminum TaxID=718193 RepID=A0A1G8YIP7_9GAMM|nr:ElyC/SanA/YdcF family protein [Ferrimonas sediminum]SDK02573.1 Uncharacterized SAM-binding protein YcdF, DUF218 family [Ferrimonas sediminum]
MIGFWIKKGISALLLPIPVCVFLVLIGLWQLKRRPRLGKGLILAGPLLLLALSSTVGSRALTAPLEQQYPRWHGQPVAAVLVLGFGHDGQVSDLATQQLMATALARLTEGVRIAEASPGSLLVLSGAKGMQLRPHAQVMADAAEMLGVDRRRIRTLDQAKDTQEEVEGVSRLVNGGTVAVVSSAAHLPRAMMLFDQSGLDVLAAPTDYRGRTGRWWHFSADNLQTSERALHEYLGQLWLRLKSMLA